MQSPPPPPPRDYNTFKDCISKINKFKSISMLQKKLETAARAGTSSHKSKHVQVEVLLLPPDFVF